MKDSAKTVPYKWLHFKGDYSELKNIGYEFFKMYAGNYMQWSTSESEFGDTIRIWKRGAELTVDELNGYQGYFLEELIKNRDCVTSFQKPRFGEGVYYFVNTSTKQGSFSKMAADTLSTYEYQMFISPEEIGCSLYDNRVMEKKVVSLWLIETLLSLYDKGWVEIVDGKRYV